MSAQLQEQQNMVHTLKTENNSLKIYSNQLKQTVDGQKVSYENLRNQLASVYKEQQKESKKEVPSTYVPKVSVNVSGRDAHKSSLRGYDNEIKEDTDPKMPMNSRWAKPVTEITRPSTKSSTSTPRPVQFSYKSSLTRNENKEVWMMEKYCSNSVSEILNWGFAGDSSH